VSVARTILTSICLLSLLVLAACGSPASAGLRVEDAWARPAMAGGEVQGTMGQGMAAPGTGAVFMRLVNDGSEADRLRGGQTDVASVVEIHETVLQGEVMKMQMLPEGLEIPAGGEVLLKPGSYHVMLIGIRDDLAPGERFSMDLQFEKAGTVTIEVEVREP
jgi:copper(I)-binding protein